MQKYATRGHDNIGREAAQPAGRPQAGPAAKKPPARNDFLFAAAATSTE
jgi:hypothetical protein